ncbi:putative reverse transcriptase domain-containing protein [Tanacetum coccineum]
MMNIIRLKILFAKRMNWRQDLTKLRNEMRNMVMANNNGAVVRKAGQNIPKFGGDGVKGWLFKIEQFFEVNNISNESKSIEVENGIVEDVVVETVKESVEVENKVIGDEKTSNDIRTIEVLTSGGIEINKSGLEKLTRNGVNNMEGLSLTQGPKHPIVTIPLLPDFGGVTDWYQEPRVMPPRRLKKKSVKRLVEKRVAKAIEEYEKSRANLDSAGSSGGNPGNAGGTVNVQGCSHKTFMNGKPHSFNGTEGVVGLRRWIEKVEQVFETCKCAEEDKVMFAASTFEGRALTWWNGNVHTLGLVNANHIPWTEFKTMMTTEYCPATEIQRMEQELWTLTLKGDDIEAYNNRFHELALMCPELVPTEKKKIERYTRGFPERIKGNITSSKPATLHDAINMARELVEQTVQGRATRIGESNKRKWEDHQRNTNNNNHNNHNNNNNNRNRNNNYHQQQNRRQETARAYAAAPAEGRGYAGNLPKCNRCNSHHNGQCPPKCQKCQRTGHREKDCRVRVPGAGVTLQDGTCRIPYSLQNIYHTLIDLEKRKRVS